MSVSVSVVSGRMSASGLRSCPFVVSAAAVVSCFACVT